MDLVLLRGLEVQIAGDIFVSNFIDRHRAQPFARVIIPVEDDVVDEPRGVIRTLRDAMADIGKQIVVEVDVALAGAETRGTRSGNAVRIGAVAGADGMIDMRV